MTVTLVAVLFVGSALVAVGLFAAAWRRELTAALIGIPLMFGGAGAAFVGVARFAGGGSPRFGDEVAIVLALVALAVVVLGVGVAGRESSR